MAHSVRVADGTSEGDSAAERQRSGPHGSGKPYVKRKRGKKRKHRVLYAVK